MRAFDHKAIEKKWQKRWEEEKAFEAVESAKEKSYLLIEFPYPSGAGLHVGHVRSFTAMDVVARKRRREGKGVLYPIGWDAFGLPTENYAIQTGRNPKDITKENTDTFRRQLKSLGLSFNWDREVNTTDPEYYKWTQWIFLKLFEKGLAYKAEIPINWCPNDKIGLANEEVIDGGCERCGTPVEKRMKEQWMLKITEYAQRLYDDLDTVNYIERAKIQQKNWIGPSQGAEIDFPISDSEKVITVFTTRPDTLFGATYMVLAPEHPLLEELKGKIQNWDEVVRYIVQSGKKTEFERNNIEKEKTGVKLEGVVAVNPANKEEIPIFIADYVLMGYGTGAIMAVPAHDERDFEFAQKFNLPVKEVVIQQITERVPGAKTRTSVHCILQNEDGDILVQIQTLDNRKTYTLPGGGIEGTESEIEALTRELQEETGYQEFKDFIRIGTVEGTFYARAKDLIREMNGIGYVVTLASNSMKEPALTEAEARSNLDHKWVSASTALELLLSVANGDDGAHVDAELLRRYLASEYVYTGVGILANSNEFTGLVGEEAGQKIVEAIGGRFKTTYKLRDWIFSRQRYWGEPIPMINCKECGWVPVPESELPVELPHVEKYEPTESGESPLAAMDEWVKTTCPKCGKEARRETDTMPNWAGSSWYYLRYCDPENNEALASKESLRYWTPVDWYNGGMEHTVLHLLYSRFWHKFLFDIGVVPTSEPYQKRTSHGMILAEDGEKMSKSRGNVINPDDITQKFGADSLRVYEMFMGPFDQAIGWSTNGLVGARRFLERVADLKNKVTDSNVSTDEQEYVLHKTIAKVSGDIEELKMNTAIASLMELSNELSKGEGVSREAFKTLLLLLAPFAPHLSAELWEDLGEQGDIHQEPWPAYESAKLVRDVVTIGVQVNGKLRGEVTLSPSAPEDEAFEKALQNENVEKWIGGEITKKVYIPGRIISFLTKS